MSQEAPQLDLLPVVCALKELTSQPSMGPSLGPRPNGETLIERLALCRPATVSDHFRDLVRL